MINIIVFDASEKPLCTQRRCHDYRGNDEVQFSVRGALELGQIGFGARNLVFPKPLDLGVVVTGAGRMLGQPAGADDRPCADAQDALFPET
ncbi:hypothetical protein NKH57_11270 [Mesorhizobium sp. M1050]